MRTLTLSFVVLLLSAVTLRGQTAPLKYNRKLTGFELVPAASGARGLFDAHFQVELELCGLPQGKLDLSSRVELKSLGSGAVLDEILFEASVQAGDVTACGGLGCPGPCGTGVVHGERTPMQCKNSSTVPGSCTCVLICPGVCKDCAIDGVLVAEIHPQPFSLPEIFREDDIVKAAVPASKPRYDRSVVVGQVNPSEEGPAGTYDVYANIFIQTFADSKARLDLSTRVLFQDDHFQTQHTIDVAVSVDSSQGGHCEANGCPNNCGAATLDSGAIGMSCAEYDQTPFGCGCSIRVPLWCKGIALGGKGVVEVQAASGSLPEIYNLNNRDFLGTPRVISRVPQDQTS